MLFRVSQRLACTLPFWRAGETIGLLLERETDRVKERGVERERERDRHRWSEGERE